LSGVYYALIIFPTIFLLTLIFIFQSSIDAIEGQQFIINCPYPIYEGVIANVGDLAVDGVFVKYNVTHNRDINGNTTTNDQDKVGTRFECDSNGVSAGTREYGKTLFDFIPYGWLGYTADSITAFFSSVQARVVLLFIYFDAPAQVSGLSFFTFINVFLLGLVSLGGFMVARGN